MWTGIRIVPDNVNIDFIGQRYIAYAFTAFLMIASIFLLTTKGLNYGIDFTGGTLIEVETAEVPDLSDLREELNNLNLGEIAIQEFGQPNHLLIRLPAQDGPPEVQTAAINTVKDNLSSKYENIDYRRVEFVGPQVGEELKVKGFYAVLFAALGIMGYVWFRYEWQFGLSAVIAIAHDVIAVLGFMALTGKTFDLSTLAAVLMVAGFSINDTVVIFDRIREILRKFRKKALGEVCNIAINETLSRTIMTSLLTILALVALWVFGGEVIQGFVDALLFGYLVGTYSSIYVSSPLLLYLGVRPQEEKTNDIEEVSP
jgi:preprotein translocase subunit SecF